jgi:transposase
MVLGMVTTAQRVLAGLARLKERGISLGRRPLEDSDAARVDPVGRKPSGGSISPLEAHAAFLFALIARQADLTLDEIVAAMHKRRIAGSRSAVWRFFQRHKISFKKSLRAAEQERADVARAQRRWMREQGMFDPARHGVSRRDRDLDQHGAASRAAVRVGSD